MDLKEPVASQDKLFHLPHLLPECPDGKQEVGFLAEGNVTLTAAAEVSLPHGTPAAAVVLLTGPLQVGGILYPVWKHQ